MNPSTRSLRSSRRSSPVTEPLAPTDPLTTHDLTNVCAVIRERLLLAPADKPAVSVQAFFRRKDEPNESIKAVRKSSSGRFGVMGRVGR